MNASSVDIADMLVSDSALGLEIGVDLFVGKEPARPQNCVTIRDTYGMPPQLTMEGQGMGYEYPSVQILVRNQDYRTAETLIHDIMLSLHGRANETWNDTLYTVIYCANGPALLTWDDNELAKFVVNFNLQRR